MPLRRNLAWSLLLLIPALSSPTAARAAMATFSYAGSDPDDGYVRSTGTLTFAYADGLTTVRLGNLTAFQFVFTITSTDPSLRYTDTFTFKQSDLTSFSATASSSGQITALTLRTGLVAPPDGFLAPELLVVSSLRPGGVVSYFDNFGDDAQHGTITPSVVPEPGSLALLGIASGLGLVGRRSRRRG